MIKFGEIEAEQILRNEFAVTCLEMVLDFIGQNNPGLKISDKKEQQKIRRKAAKILKEKYPNTKIELVKEKNK
ncbi:hypothetical protein KA005_04420 [bacterium]|nr:hypothetical protein [bacterium]